jgi:hypothetical protein
VSDLEIVDRMVSQMQGRVKQRRTVDKIYLTVSTNGKPRKTKQARMAAHLAKAAVNDQAAGGGLARPQPHHFERVLPIGQRWCDVDCGSDFDLIL